MNKHHVLALAMVGLVTACNGSSGDPDMEDEEAIGSVDQPVIVGSVDWSSATSLTGAKAQAAQAVGYLDIPAASARCTAWLLTDDLVITNNHCIGSATAAAGARVSFDYNDGVATPTWYDCSTFVATWSNLDMTALRCSELNGVLPGEANGYLRFAASDAAAAASIYVLHQNCDYYTAACSPTKKHSPGSILNPSFSATDASYDADTLGGSSGSPVLLSASNNVVALHHYGWNGNSQGRGDYNSGVRTSQIRSALLELDPAYTSATHHFPFDEGSGATTADTIGSKTGTLGASASFGGGLVGGGAITLSGGSPSYDLTSFVDFGAAIARPGKSNFTVTHWYKTTFNAAGRQGDVLGNRVDHSHGNFFSVRINGSGVITLELDEDASGTNYVAVSGTTMPVNDGAWHHLAYVRKGDLAKLFVDGVLAGSAATASGLRTDITGASSFRIGRRLQANVAGFDSVPGSYDDLRFHDRALTAGEISRLAAK